MMFRCRNNLTPYIISHSLADVSISILYVVTRLLDHSSLRKPQMMIYRPLPKRTIPRRKVTRIPSVRRQTAHRRRNQRRGMGEVRLVLQRKSRKRFPFRIHICLLEVLGGDLVHRRYHTHFNRIFAVVGSDLVHFIVEANSFHSRKQIHLMLI
jgi:hypothetical protein